jgi:hypothetical protein
MRAQEKGRELKNDKVYTRAQERCSDFARVSACEHVSHHLNNQSCCTRAYLFTFSLIIVHHRCCTLRFAVLCVYVCEPLLG